MLRMTAALGLFIFLSACAAPGETPVQKRQNIESMRQQVLTDIYRQKPAVRGIVNAAPGYAVFSNVNVNLILLAAGSGYGVVVNNANGKRTFMKMAEGGFGFGAGVKDFRVLFVFETKKAMNNFLQYGWQIGANADATAKAGNKGGALGKEAVVDGISVYQLTENGLALQATLKGVKFWVDDDLN